MISALTLVWAALIVCRLTRKASGESLQTDRMNVSFVYDISDNTKMGVFYHDGSDTYKAVQGDFNHLIDKYNAEYNAYATITYQASYTDGVDSSNKMGYIYPYEEVSKHDLEDVVTVDQIYNLDSYDGIPNIVLILVDDIGWNDFDLGLWDSTLYKGDAFPAMKALMEEGGITIANHISAAYCSPARGQLLTGKYSSYVNMDDTASQMHIYEATIGHEMKSAGYYTTHIGKWGVGWTKYLYTPLYKGFDQSFGYYGNSVEKYAKTLNSGDTSILNEAGYTGSYVDLWEDGIWAGTQDSYFGVGAEDAELDAYLPNIFSRKAQTFFEEYSEKDTDAPFFLYFASDLAHSPYVAPDYYSERCNDSVIVSNFTNDIDGIKKKCAMMLVLDETIGNLTCKLESLGMAENTLFAFASDNGGDVPGDNYPYLGGKFYEVEGGIKTPAAIFGSLIPEEKRGTSYSNLFHVTDWLPTLMQVATKGEWTESAKGSENVIDGVSHWDHLMGKSSSGMRPRDSALTYVDDEGRISIIQYQGEKLFHFMRGLKTEATLEPDQLYTVGGESYTTCEVSDLSFAGMLPAVATRFFLRTKVAIADGTAAAMDMSIGVSTTTRLAMLAMLASLVALTLGSLLYKLHAARKKDPAVYKPVNTRYGAFAEDAGDDDSLLGM